MTIKELIKILEQFDENAIVLAKDEFGIFEDATYIKSCGKNTKNEEIIEILGHNPENYFYKIQK